MHIAGATNSKIIALFGSTPSKRFAPENSIVLEVKSKGCPCYNIYGNYDKICKEDCMKNIGIDRVFAKLNYFLKR
jgi:ADP-heptose:LPS heptosyltransferase